MKHRLYHCALIVLLLCNVSHIYGQSQKTYQNPVLDRNFPDPTVIKAPDGYFYAYATQGKVNIQVARSKDLVHWKYLGGVMPVKPSWADQTQAFWAPDILYDTSLGTYYLYFSSKHNTKNGHCIGVATSKQPLGPFKDAGEPIICGKGFVNIDPMAFDDPQTGKKLLYWGSGFEPLKVRELADNRVEFKKGSETIPIVYPKKEANYTNLLEGLWVTLHNGKYYLYYSGDNCCGKEANYAVMVARADSAKGPFTRLGEVNDSGSSVILAKSKEWLAPGHNAVIEDSLGRQWMLYHAIDRTPKDGTINYGRRVMLLDRIYYQNGWPYIKGGVSSVKADSL